MRPTFPRTLLGRTGSGLLLCGLALAGPQAQVTETYEDGTPRARYSLDDGERFHGNYTEYHANGRVRFRVPYRHGDRNGVYLEYFASGRLRVSARYREGRLHGKYEERDEEGRPALLTTYEDGVIVGSFVAYAGEAEISRQQWEAGELRTLNGVTPYPKSSESIADALEAIFAIERGPGAGRDADAPERHEALQWLMAYRYLCDVPHEGMELVEQMNAHAAAGSRLCEAIGRLEHKPANPGWPKAEFDFAYLGTSRSNLCMGRTIPESVTSYMDDSDERNIDRVGHRRWCLNPPLLRVGFGASGKFSAMYCMDRSRKPPPDYEFVSYPPRGLLPVDYFQPHYAWSVSLHPRKFGPPDPKAVKIRVRPLDERYLPGKPLELQNVRVQTSGAGIPLCVIFRPKAVAVKDGARYWTEITGLTARDGAPRRVAFLVEFFDL
jgi:hypothetical protein